MSIHDRLLKGSTPGEWSKLLALRLPEDEPLPPRLPAGNDHTKKGLRKRRDVLRNQNIRLKQLSGNGAEIEPAKLDCNIENLVGFARIPVGVIGPLRINGTNAHGDFYVPMATTEGSLVASYNRGSYVASHSGGVSALLLTESVGRAPCFVFNSMAEAGRFIAWVLPQFESLQEVVGRTSRHCRLIDIRTSLIGKEVYLNFEFTTGDASGQNMVTLATDAICRHLVERAPVKPSRWYVEGNLSGDKKATMRSFLYARGKKVVAEAIIPRSIMKRFLHIEPDEMLRYWHISVLGGAQSGSIGVQGHYANALAAIFIACGQDVACVSEASIGLTRIDITSGGNLYMSVTLPNMIVGTVGGGTHLPTARECLEMIDCYGDGRAGKFAEICAAAVLAGELSIISALATGEFASAHAKYGRKRT